MIEKINNDQVIEVNGESIEVTGLQKIKEIIALKIRNNEDYSYEQQILDKSNEIIDFVLTGESTDPEIVSEYKVSSLQYYIKKDSTAIEKIKNIIEKYDKSKNEDLSVQKITELKGELEELKNDDVHTIFVEIASVAETEEVEFEALALNHLYMWDIGDSYLRKVGLAGYGAE